MVKLALSFFLTGGKVTIFFSFYNAKLNVEPYYNADMILFKHSKDLQSYLKKIESDRKSIGFVPTMGALHAGHLSLIEESKKQY